MMFKEALLKLFALSGSYYSYSIEPVNCLFLIKHNTKINLTLNIIQNK